MKYHMIYKPRLNEIKVFALHEFHKTFLDKFRSRSRTALKSIDFYNVTNKRINYLPKEENT